MFPRKPYYKRQFPVTATFKPYNTQLQRSTGSARAAKAGTKLNYFNCTVNGTVRFLRKANEYYSDVIAFHPCVGKVNPQTGMILDDQMGNIYGGLVNDRSFRLNCAQFDEFRIVSMKVRMNVAYTEDGTLTLCTISDRSAYRDEIEMDQAEMTDVDSDTPNFREVCESQGSMKTIINKNRITPITRMLFARDMNEKITYSDCTITYSSVEGASPLSNITLDDWPAFKPALYCCLQFSNTTSQSATYSFGYSVEYNCVFRNPKSDLSTFIIKEDPSYVNPAPGPDDSRKGVAIIKSTDPYLPDIILKDGKETNISWLQRYLARVAIKNATKYAKSDSSPLIITVTDEDKKEDEEKKPMDIEDDPGTA